MSSELQIDNLHAAYRKKEVLRGASLVVRPGEVVAMVGPNGAGKSTLLKALAGFLRPSRGSVRLGGTDLLSLPPHERARAGLAYFMQGGRVFPNLTTAENLELAAAALAERDGGKGIGAVVEAFPGLSGLLGLRAGLLSGGERQLLALAMVLVKRPRVLLLDEPSMGLSPRLVRDLLEHVCTLGASWGAGILIVEQNLQDALRVAHRALALVRGEVVLSTERPQQWLTGDDLQQLFWGGAAGGGRAA